MAQVTFQKQVVLTNLAEAKQTFDGGFVATGWYSNPSGNQDVCLIRTNSLGDTIWTRIFGEAEDVQSISMDITSDSGYIIAGWTYIGATDSAKVYLIRTNANGDTLWIKKLGGTRNDDGRCVRQTLDGGFIISGETNSFGAGYQDTYIIKTDANGNVEWSKALGGPLFDYGYAICETDDSGFVALVTFNAFSNNSDILLVKMNSLGDTLWSKSYGGSGVDMGFDIVETFDHGFAVMGYTNSFGSGGGDGYLLVTDSTGNLLWSKTYGDTGDEFGTGISQTPDSGYILCGYTSSFGVSTLAPYLIKVNAEGDLLWSETYEDSNYGVAWSVIQTFDGGYLTAGEQNELMKLNSNGESGCNEHIANTVVTTPSTIVSNPPISVTVANTIAKPTSTAVSSGVAVINVCPAQVAFSSSANSICEKFCIGFFDESINNPTSWLWLFPGGNPSSSVLQNPVNICYNTPGTYDVTLITTNAQGSNTLTLTNFITVYATPAIPTITQIGYTLTSSPAFSYQWQFNSADIPGATNQSYTILQTGFYSVVVSNPQGCISSSTLLYVLISEVDEMSGDGGISIYPNPSSGNFTVELLQTENSRDVSIDVVNTLDQKIFSYSEKIPSRDFKKQIDLSNIADGVYFIEIQTENEFLRKKIVVAD